MKEARYWHTEGSALRCELCPWHCLIREGKAGICQARVNHQGRLVAGMYARITACHLDPIEKKPLYHVKPGRAILSVGSGGCNFKCGFCQNWDISQVIPDTMEAQPKDVAEKAVAVDSCGVAYTYNEPIINIEYVMDCARQVKAKGLINVMVSNGFINPGPLEDLIPLIDAWNIDLKSMDDSFYREVCHGHVGPVKATIKRVSQSSHVEVTHLMVPDRLHSLEQVRDLAAWLASCSPSIPLHLTRYYPQYHYHEEATDVDFMHQAYGAAKQYLKWVYLGNIPGDEGNTFCPQCGQLLIERRGYRNLNILLKNNHCPQCGADFYGIS